MFWKGGVSKEGKNIMYVRSLFVDAGCHITLMCVSNIFTAGPTNKIHTVENARFCRLFIFYLQDAQISK